MSKNNGRVAAVRDSAGAAEAAERAMHAATEIELGNGIVLSLKPVPPSLVRRAVESIERPVAPTFRNDLTGKDEENPIDPGFVRLEAEYQQKTIDVIADLMLLMGTSVKHLPEGVWPPESEDWLEWIEYLRLPVAVKCWRCLEGEPREGCSGCKKARYLSWLEFYAVESETDLLQVMLGTAALSGINESEVASAIASFRSRTVGRADPGVPAAKPVADGDHVPEAAAESSP